MRSGSKNPRARRTVPLEPVTRELPADLLTPVSAFLRLRRKGERAFLLESVEGGERLARWSFLGVRPERAFILREGRLWEQPAGGKATALPGKPEKELRRLIERYQPARVNRAGLPAFCGGLVGFVGYDLVPLLEPKVPVARAASVFPFDAYLMLYRTVVAFDHVKHRIVLVSNVPAGDRKARASAERELSRLEQALSRPARDERVESAFAGTGRSDAKGRSRELESVFVPSLGRHRHAEAIGRIKRHIRKGDIFQCVLSEQFSFSLRGDPFRVYRALRASSPAPYLYYLALGEKGEDIMLGASPEMLTRVSEGQAQTCPIAGTRPRSDDPTRDRELERQLLSSVKERAEHLMLVDLGRNDLGRVCAPGTVSVPEFMKLHRFSHVMHLVSTVQGKLAPGRNAWDAFFSCFPAGTLTGAPKIRAMQIIADNELAARGPYGGAGVYQDFSGNLDSCITIRSLFVSRGRAVIQAGGGVVADSTAEKEYDEILNKTRAIRRAVVACGAASKRGPGKVRR